jgi:hypothetical protein
MRDELHSSVLGGKIWSAETGSGRSESMDQTGRGTLA